MGESVQLQSVTLTLAPDLPEDKIFAVASALEDEATSVSWLKNTAGWQIQWVFSGVAPLKELEKSIIRLGKIKLEHSQFIVEDVPDVNWLEESYRQFPPFTVGPFFIFGSHFDGKIPKGKIPLQIDAATAFGSGEHGTTRGCLEALGKLHAEGFKPKRILDMGTGSGILAIAAYKLWKKPTLAIDIDKEATRMACHHRKTNAVPAGERGVTCATGDGFAARQLGAATYDLVIANILAGPLVSMAPDLASRTKSGGVTLLSGLLISQESDIISAYRANGFGAPRRITHGEWRTLLLNKRG
jgi:ribosomal protein L11 methyltransferase